MGRSLPIFDVRSDHSLRPQCVDGPRPCPHTTCGYHLGVEDTWGGRGESPGIRTERRLAEKYESCALDVADRGGATNDEVAKILGLSRIRVVQIVSSARAKLKALGVDPRTFLHRGQ